MSLGALLLPGAAPPQQKKPLLFQRDTRIAPAFRLPSFSGEVKTLADYRGKLLLLNFWATWCPPCRQEMPVLSSAHRRWASSNVAIVGVAMDAQGWSKVTPFLKENPVSYEILLGNPKVARDYRAGRVYPTTVVVSPDGEILGSISTAVEADDLERIIVSLVEELRKPYKTQEASPVNGVEQASDP